MDDRPAACVTKVAAASLALATLVSWTGGSAASGATGGGGRVAFARVGDRPGIYLLDTKDGDVMRLSWRRDTAPTWSPDGSMLAFRRYNESQGRYDLVVAEADGSARRRVATDLAGPWGREFAWSPDGTMIAYGSRPATGVEEVVVVDLASDARVVIEDALYPTWAPDGSRIAYAAHREDHPDCGMEIFTARPDGTEVEQLTRAAFAQDYQPAWSPDGATIAFLSTRDHDHSHDPAECDERYGFHTSEELYAVPAEGGKATRLTRTYTYKSNPVWSPDGSRMAFLAQCSIDVCYPAHPTTDLFVIGAGGGEERNKTRTPRRSERQPAWSPDGSMVGYSSMRGRGSRIEVVTVRSRARSVLVDRRGPEMDPHWQP